MSLTQINKAGLDELALDHVFTIGASGSSAYTFQGEGLNGTVNNPTLYLTRGKTYRFENGSGGHPIRIQSTSGASGTAYNTGVTNNAGSGTVIVEVQHDAPDVLYYQCTSHAAMNGILYITGALADGGVTTAKIADAGVTTAKLADDAVTSAKIADGQIGSQHIVDGSIGTGDMANQSITTAKIANDAITSAKIADDVIGAEHIIDNSVQTAAIQDEAITLAKLPHGTSSNDGKFLRANNGADPTFESLPSSGLSNIVEDTSPQLGGLLGTEGFNIAFGDGSTSNGALNRLTMGASNDLQIFHNGTNSIIENATGALVVKPEGLMRIQDRTTDEVRADFVDNGEVSLYYNNIKKIETTSTGIKITGETEAGGGATSGNIQMVNGGRKNTIGNHFSTNSTDSRIEIGISDGSTSGGTNRVASFSYAGLAFGHDTASANRLDDYEEGTWTLNYANGANYSIQSGTNVGQYVKVGRICFIQGYIRITSVTNGQSWTADISGLPFTSGISGYDQPISVMGLSWSWGSGQSGLVGQVRGGSTQIRLRNNRYDGHGYTVTANNMTNATRVWVAGCYYV